MSNLLDIFRSVCWMTFLLTWIYLCPKPQFYVLQIITQFFDAYAPNSYAVYPKGAKDWENTAHKFGWGWSGQLHRNKHQIQCLNNDPCTQQAMNKHRCIGAFRNSDDLWMEMIINYKQTWNNLVTVIVVYSMHIQ